MVMVYFDSEYHVVVHFSRSFLLMKYLSHPFIKSIETQLQMA